MSLKQVLGPTHSNPILSRVGSDVDSTRRGANGTVQPRTGHDKWYVRDNNTVGVLVHELAISRQDTADGYRSNNHAGGGNAPAAVKELLKLLPPASSFGGPYVNVQMLMEFMGGLDKLPAEGLADDEAPEGVSERCGRVTPHVVLTTCVHSTCTGAKRQRHGPDRYVQQAFALGRKPIMMVLDAKGGLFL